MKGAVLTKNAMPGVRIHHWKHDCLTIDKGDLALDGDAGHELDGALHCERLGT